MSKDGYCRVAMLQQTHMSLMKMSSVGRTRKRLGQGKPISFLSNMLSLTPRLKFDDFVVCFKTRWAHIELLVSKDAFKCFDVDWCIPVVGIYSMNNLPLTAFAAHSFAEMNWQVAARGTSPSFAYLVRGLGICVTPLTRVSLTHLWLLSRKRWTTLIYEDRYQWRLCRIKFLFVFLFLINWSKTIEGFSLWIDV